MNNNLYISTENVLVENFRDYETQIEELEERLDELEQLLQTAKDFNEDIEEIKYLINQIQETESAIEILENKQKEEYINELKDLPKETLKTDFKGFDITKTDPPLAQEYLPGNKNREYLMNKYGYTLAYIAEVTPEQYLLLCGKYGWKAQYDNIEDIYDNLTAESKNIINEYAEDMKAGNKFPMPYIDILKQSQEGRHRSFAAIQAGIQTIPCLILA